LLLTVCVIGKVCKILILVYDRDGYLLQGGYVVVVCLSLVAIRITVWIQGLFSGFVTIERYGKWLTYINPLRMLTVLQRLRDAYGF